MQTGKKWARSAVTHLKFSFALPPRDTSGQPAGTAPARRLRKHADTVGDTERLPAWNASTSSRDSRTPFMTAWMAVTSLRTKRASGESRPCTANRLASFAGGMSCGISLRASATTSAAFPLSSVGRMPERVRLVRRLVAKEVRRDCWPTGTVQVKRWWGCQSNEKQSHEEWGEGIMPTGSMAAHTRTHTFQAMAITTIATVIAKATTLFSLMMPAAGLCLTP